MGGHAYSGYRLLADRSVAKERKPRRRTHFGTESELKNWWRARTAKESKFCSIMRWCMFMSRAHFTSRTLRLDGKGLPVLSPDRKTILDGSGKPAWFWPNIALAEDLTLS